MKDGLKVQAPGCSGCFYSSVLGNKKDLPTNKIRCNITLKVYGPGLLATRNMYANQSKFELGVKGIGTARPNTIPYSACR
jgi:hypothetical protein